MTSPLADDEMSSTELAPPRLIDGGGGHHERNLVSSARLDRVPSAAKARVAAALGGVLEPLAAPVTQTSAAERPAHGDAVTLGSRAALGAGMVGAIVLSVWLGGKPERALPQHPPAITAAEPNPPAPARSAPSPTSLSADTPAASTPEPGTSTDAAKPKAPSRSSPTGPEAPAGSGLLAEARALEAVRAALAAGKVDVAERELAAYRRRFERGELAVEAELLAIQVTLARGKRDLASAAAERLLSRPEAQHYRERVNALLERSNDAAPHIRARR